NEQPNKAATRERDSGRWFRWDETLAVSTQSSRLSVTKPETANPLVLQVHRHLVVAGKSMILFILTTTRSQVSTKSLPILTNAAGGSGLQHKTSGSRRGRRRPSRSGSGSRRGETPPVPIRFRFPAWGDAARPDPVPVPGVGRRRPSRSGSGSRRGETPPVPIRFRFPAWGDAARPDPVPVPGVGRRRPSRSGSGSRRGETPPVPIRFRFLAWGDAARPDPVPGIVDAACPVTRSVPVAKPTDLPDPPPLNAAAMPLDPPFPVPGVKEVTSQAPIPHARLVPVVAPQKAATAFLPTSCFAGFTFPARPAPACVSCCLGPLVPACVSCSLWAFCVSVVTCSCCPVFAFSVAWF
ncbi:hypothetical protein P4O66_007131, partial [Electrophorus voltai]